MATLVHENEPIRPGSYIQDRINTGSGAGYHRTLNIHEVYRQPVNLHITPTLASAIEWAEVDPIHGTCNESGRHELYEAVTGDRGKTWKLTPLTRNSSATNMRPVCVAGEEHVAVLWMRGRYSTYTDYDTDIVGFIRRR